MLRRTSVISGQVQTCTPGSSLRISTDRKVYEVNYAKAFEELVQRNEYEEGADTKSLVGELMTIQDVSRLMKCSTRHIRRMVRQGSFPRPLKIGRLSRWASGCVSTWLESKTPQL